MHCCSCTNVNNMFFTQTFCNSAPVVRTSTMGQSSDLDDVNHLRWPGNNTIMTQNDTCSGFWASATFSLNCAAVRLRIVLQPGNLRRMSVQACCQNRCLRGGKSNNQLHDRLYIYTAQTLWSRQEEPSCSSVGQSWDHFWFSFVRVLAFQRFDNTLISIDKPHEGLSVSIL